MTDLNPSEVTPQESGETPEAEVQQETLPQVQEETEKPTEQAIAEKRYGKFCDADALFKAYKALEAEFTKRCQEAKALEYSAVESAQECTRLKTKLDQILTDEEFLERAAQDVRVAERVVKSYLTERLLAPKPAPVLQGSVGFSVSAPAPKPKTLEEAKYLVQQMLKQ
ncbi:MAG: hypothetical protein FWH03_01240 [Firmicutes bacterium]|nr:hypothetical protein [Bacillota bacterium]